MKGILLGLAFFANPADWELRVVRLHSDPDQILRNLRDGNPPITTADCHALDLWECRPDDPRRISDLSLRWVHLNDKPGFQAILVAKAEDEMSWMAYVFDKQGTWTLVGSFECRRCFFGLDDDSLVRVQKLTMDSPPMLLVHRDLGGSDGSDITTEAFLLRDGRLRPVFQLVSYQDSLLDPDLIETQRVLSTQDRRRLVIHTLRFSRSRRRTRYSCEVWRWEQTKDAFVSVPQERVDYCDPKTGRPVPDKSFPTDLRVYPTSPLTPR